MYCRYHIFMLKKQNKVNYKTILFIGLVTLITISLDSIYQSKVPIITAIWIFVIIIMYLLNEIIWKK